MVPADGARLENLVACHLLKWVHWRADAWQISAVGRKDYQTADGIRVAPALELLRGLV